MLLIFYIILEDYKYFSPDSSESPFFVAIFLYLKKKDCNGLLR
ncbi:hypothetical protein FPSM_01635 [Flavobacterium psychrophilum]|nr:hypothetical protein FPSM_01635 [Flavobacterium psychrophilum]